MYTLSCAVMLTVDSLDVVGGCDCETDSSICGDCNSEGCVTIGRPRVFESYATGGKSLASPTLRPDGFVVDLDGIVNDCVGKFDTRIGCRYTT